MLTGSRLTARLATVCLVLVAAFAVATSIDGLRTRVTVPIRDDWAILDRMFTRASLAQWVWADHNGHRMLGARLLTYLDYVWLQGTMLLPVAASIACTWMGALAIAACFGREAHGTSARLTLAFALFILFWSACSYDFFWGLEVTAVGAATWTIVALASFAAWTVRSRTRPAAGFLVLTLGAATIATFSHGPGFSVWPALVGVGLLSRTPLWIPLLFVATAMVEMGVYVVGLQHTRGGAIYGDLLLHHVAEVWQMDAAYLGAPATRVLAAFRDWELQTRFAISTCIGALAMVAAGVRIYDFVRAPARMRARDLLGLGLMAASATSGGMVALNRHPFVNTSIDIRFAMWTGLFWVGLVCTLPPASDGPRERRAGALAVLVIALSALMLPSLTKAWTAREMEEDATYASALMHVLGIQWDAMSGGMWVGPSPARSYRVVAHLKADHRSMFADRRAELPGTLLHDRFTVLPQRHCRAELLWRQAIAPQTGPALRIAGSTSEPGARSALAAVFTDDRDVIRGLAVHVAQLDLPQSFVPVEHPWLGALRDYDPGTTYTVNLIRPDGRSVCRGPTFRERE